MVFPGHPSLYYCCQKCYEWEWDTTESRGDWECFCGYIDHPLSIGHTPILFKKGDKVKVIMINRKTGEEKRLEVPDATMAMYGVRFQPQGLMPKGWSIDQTPGEWKVMGTAIETNERS